MNRLLAVVGVLFAVVSMACGPAKLAGPPSGFEGALTSILQSAPFVPPPAGAKVVALIYTLPGPDPYSQLDVRPLSPGRLPPWVSQSAGVGVATKNRPGAYVGVFTLLPTPQIRYVAPVNDPRDIRGELLNPIGSAVLVTESKGTYSARAPFLPGSVAVGFEIGTAQSVSRVQFFLPFAVAPPSPHGFRFAVHH